MINILIIDDDTSTRTRLKTLIDWESEGYQLIGEAENGKIAVTLIEKLKPHIVITDMNMPHLDGVGVIKWIQDKQLPISIVALSGYDDFGYVKNSMQAGAVDYLLKHELGERELLEALSKAKDNLEQKAMRRHEHYQAIAHSQLILHKKREAFFRELIGNESKLLAEDEQALIIDKEWIKEHCQTLELPSKMTPCTLIVIDFDEYKLLEAKEEQGDLKQGHLKRIEESFLDMLLQITKDYPETYSFAIQSGRYGLIQSYSQAYSTLFVYHQIHQMLKRVQTTLKKQLNMTACYGVSPLFYRLELIRKMYDKTLGYLANRLYQGKNKIFMEDNIEAMTQQWLTLSREQEKQLAAALITGDHLATEQEIMMIFDRMYEQRLHLKSVQMLVSEVLRVYHSLAQKNGITLTTIYKSHDPAFEILSRLETLDEIKVWLLTLTNNLLIELVAVGANQEVSQSVKKALVFIQNHYQDDISLEETARFVGVSPAHLSRLFKEEFQTNYSKYVNAIRVEKAKQLMDEGDGKLKDIVEKVGFRNYNYFFKVFKDIVGMTPIAYIEQK